MQSLKMITSVGSDAMTYLPLSPRDHLNRKYSKHGINLEYLADNSGTQAGVENLMHATFSV